jgi:protoporphyrinogen/coproporphyrinogen III oxidase
LGERVRLERRLRTVARTETGYRVHLDDGTYEEADGVVLAVPASSMAPALADLKPKMSTLLSEIGFGSTATVAYAWRSSEIAHPLDAFGFVVPHREGRALLASTWASKKFAGRAPAGLSLIRVFFGGDRGEAVLARSDEQLALLGRSELRALLGVTAEPLFSSVTRQTNAMPKYTLGHRARVEGIEAALAELPGLALAGNSLYGVGIPDAIAAGERAAEQVCRLLASRGLSQK